jgi:soluble lytic murein transglycosylase-like protein
MCAALLTLCCMGCQDPQQLETLELGPIQIAQATPEPTATQIAWLPPSVARFTHVAEVAGRAHGVDPDLLLIVALVESGGWRHAESPSGARGLMQIMPATGRIIADERRLGTLELDDLYEPPTSFDFGAWYLARQLERFGTDDADESVELAAAAYNGGPTHLRRHLEEKQPLADQTARYRRWVGEMWRQRRQARSETFAAWLAAGGERLIAHGVAEMLSETEKP